MSLVFSYFRLWETKCRSTCKCLLNFEFYGAKFDFVFELLIVKGSGSMKERVEIFMIKRNA